MTSSCVANGSCSLQKSGYTKSQGESNQLGSFCRLGLRARRLHSPNIASSDRRTGNSRQRSSCSAGVRTHSRASIPRLDAFARRMTTTASRRYFLTMTTISSWGTVRRSSMGYLCWGFAFSLSSRCTLGRTSCATGQRGERCTRTRLTSTAATFANSVRCSVLARR